VNDEAHGQDFQEGFNDEDDGERKPELIEHLILLRQILAVFIVHSR
jgi:hypothetical protein